MEQVKNKKKGIIIAGISAIVLIAVLGISFAIWNYSRTTDNQILVAGDIYMKFKENPAITIENALPSEGPGANDYFEFTIEGKNTYNKPIWYEIDIQHGEEHETRQTRIEDNLLVFKLVEVKEEDQEEVLIEKGSYTGLKDGKGIYVDTIPAGTNNKITRTYRLYMWISSDTIIGNTSDANYDMEKWNDVYASIKVNVTGDFNEKKIPILTGPASDVVKDTIVSNVTDTCTEPGFNGGLVAINTEGKLYQENSGQEIREYRYVGPNVNNYVYFNCQDGKEQNGDNCEIWRILGIFKDEEGVEHIKIVKNEVLNEKKAWNSDIANDWVNATLKTYLNTEYYNTLSTNAKNMIEETKYYLGNVNDSSSVITNYTYERGNKPCAVIDDEQACRGGDIRKRNQAEWSGNIALMYPSDVGYLVNSCYWSASLSGMDIPTWLANHSDDEALLSPHYESWDEIIEWREDDIAYGWTDGSENVRPTLYLKSYVKIISGSGTSEQPYQLSIK